MNDRLLRAIHRQPCDYTPVWIMRQAGRYLPEYRKIRSKAGSFLNLCKNVELACEVSLQPLQRFDLDAVILFSDILTIPDAMDLGLEFREGEGPCFHRPLRSEKDVLALPEIEVKHDLAYVISIAAQLRTYLQNKVPLIGFSGSPWTIATYMIEGKSPGNFMHSKQMLYETPQLMEYLLDKLVRAVSDYLCAQIEAGVQVVQIFDTWGIALPEEMYTRFSLRPIANIIKQIRKQSNVPCIVFTKGSGLWLDAISDCGAHAVGIDWTCSLDRARCATKGKVAVQGNLDPSLLRHSSDVIRQHTRAMLDSYGPFFGHIANLGHGITPDIEPEKVQVFIDEVHRYSEKLLRTATC